MATKKATSSAKTESTKATKPAATTKATKPAATTKATKPAATTKATKPAATTKATRATKPEAKTAPKGGGTKGALVVAGEATLDAWCALAAQAGLAASDGAIALCLARGRRDLAASIAQAVAERAKDRSVVGRIAVAPAEAAPGDEAALLAELPALGCSDACTEARAAVLARIVRVLRRLSDATGTAVLAHVEAALGGLLAGQFSLGAGVGALLAALLGVEGPHASRAHSLAATTIEQGVARRYLDHSGQVGNATHSTSLSFEDVLRENALLLPLLSNAAWTVPALASHGGAWNDATVAARLADALDDAALKRLIEARAFTVELARALVRAGRGAIAREGLASYMASYAPPRPLGPTELAILDDPGARAALAAERTPDASYESSFARVTLAVEPIDAVLDRMVERTGTPFGAVPDVLELARRLQERDPNDAALDAALARAAQLAASEPATQYERQSVARARFDAARAQVELATVRRAPDAIARAEALVAELPELQRLVLAPGDRRFELDQKARLAVDAAGCAARAGALDAAGRAVGAIPPSLRATVAMELARALLPVAPSHALAVVETLATSPRAALDDASWSGVPLLVTLGEALFA